MARGTVTLHRAPDGRRIAVDVVRPPIPFRGFDYSAVFDAGYEGGDPIGYGATPDRAVDDLLEQDSNDHFTHP